jgi:sulfoacetaldehyde acetyltransferase
MSSRRHQQALFGGRLVGADITNRFDKLAGFRGRVYVDRVEDLGDVLQSALKSELPSVIEIPVDPNELPAPVMLDAQRKAR